MRLLINNFLEVEMAVNVIVSLDERVLTGILSQATELNIDLNTHIENVLNNAMLKPIEPKTSLNLNLLVDQVIQNAKNKVSGDQFHIDDVCSDQMWDQLSSGERKRLGRLFRQEVESKEIAKYLRRTSANKAVYERF
jgi:hypothetical protein